MFDCWPSLLQDCGIQLTDEPDKRCYPLDHHLLCHTCHLRRLRLPQHQPSAHLSPVAAPSSQYGVVSSGSGSVSGAGAESDIGTSSSSSGLGTGPPLPPPLLPPHLAAPHAASYSGSNAHDTSVSSYSQASSMSLGYRHEPHVNGGPGSAHNALLHNFSTTSSSSPSSTMYSNHAHLHANPAAASRGVYMPNHVEQQQQQQHYAAAQYGGAAGSRSSVGSSTPPSLQPNGAVYSSDGSAAPSYSANPNYNITDL